MNYKEVNYICMDVSIDKSTVYLYGHFFTELFINKIYTFWIYDPVIFEWLDINSRITIDIYDKEELIGFFEMSSNNVNFEEYFITLAKWR